MSGPDNIDETTLDNGEPLELGADAAEIVELLSSAYPQDVANMRTPIGAAEWNPLDDHSPGYDEADATDDEDDIYDPFVTEYSDPNGANQPRRRFWHSKKPLHERFEYKHPALAYMRRLAGGLVLSSSVIMPTYVGLTHNIQDDFGYIEDVPHRNPETNYEPVDAKRLSEQFIKQDTDKIIELDNKRQSIVSELAPLCQAFIQPYVDGKRKDLAYDSAVIDIAAEPGAPCGESQATIRDDLQELRANHASVVKLESQLERGARALRAAEKRLTMPEGERKREDLLVDVFSGALISLVAGLSVGYPHAQMQHARLKREKEAAIQAAKNQVSAQS